MDIEPLIWVAAANPGVAHEFLAPLQDACDRFGISENQERASCFLAQAAHESMGFSHLEEFLNYSAARLVKVWPRRFPTIEAAEPYAHNPRKLANKTYGGRLGNRPNTDDGWTYRGGGLFQLTGLENYRAAGEALALDLVTDPSLARKPAGAALTAAWFWNSRSLNELADKNTADAYRDMTRKINGGTTGLADRVFRLNELRRLLKLPEFPTY